MRPSDVIARRREMAEGCRRSLRGDFRPDGIDEAEHASVRRGSKDLLEILEECQAFFVSSEMCTVAAAAAQSLPVRHLNVTVVPATRGFMLFQESVGTIKIDESWSPEVFGAAWITLSADRRGVARGPSEDGYDYRFVDGDHRPLRGTVVEVIPLVDLSPHRQLPPGTILMAPSEGFRIAWQPGADLGAGGDAAALIEIGKKLLAAWVLMQQTITVSEKSHADRPERRRCQRVSIPSDYLIVRLRRVATPGDRDTSTPVSWSHRWLVSGHWTRQPYGPGRTLRRPTWINPYVKGPDDKPLVVKDKVTAWVR